MPQNFFFQVREASIGQFDFSSVDEWVKGGSRGEKLVQQYNEMYIGSQEDQTKFLLSPTPSEYRNASIVEEEKNQRIPFKSYILYSMFIIYKKVLCTN